MMPKSYLKKYNLALCFILLQIGLISIYAQATKAAYWSGYNSTSQVFPLNAVGTSTDISSASLMPSGNMISVNDNRTVWSNTNTSSNVDKDTASYLAYTLQTQDINSITFDRFVMSGTAIFGTSKLQLRWSIDNFNTSLGDFTVNGANYTLSFVDLSSYGAIAAGTIEFRVYFYNSSGLDWVFNSDAGPYTPIKGTSSIYAVFGQNIGIWYLATNQSVSTNTIDEKDFLVYPNPTNKNITIKFPNNLHSTISLYTINGKQLFNNLKTEKSEIQIDVSYLKTGIYILKIINKNRIIYKKIIKQQQLIDRQ